MVQKRCVYFSCIQETCIFEALFSFSGSAPNLVGPAAGGGELMVRGTDLSCKMVTAGDVQCGGHSSHAVLYGLKVTQSRY